MLNGLMINLVHQIDVLDAHDKVEILVEPERDMTIGAKRNLLVARATGKYLVHVDDDDQVNPSYVARILEAAERDPDVITLGVFYNEPNGITSHWHFSIEYTDMVRKESVLMMYPTHLCPMRESIARLYKFQHTNIGEDMSWSKAIKQTGLLKTEIHIGPMYHYLYRHDKNIFLDYTAKTAISVCLPYTKQAPATIKTLSKECNDTPLNVNVRMTSDTIEPDDFNAILKAHNRIRIHWGYLKDAGPIDGLKNVLRVDIACDVVGVTPRWDAILVDSFDKYARSEEAVLAFNDGRTINKFSWCVTRNGAYDVPDSVGDEGLRVEYLTRLGTAKGWCVYFKDKLFEAKPHKVDTKKVDKVVAPAIKAMKSKVKTRPQYASSQPLELRSRFENLMMSGASFKITFTKKDRLIFDSSKDKDVVPIAFTDDKLTVGNGMYSYDELRIDYANA